MPSTDIRHFLDLDRIKTADLRGIIDATKATKAANEGNGGNGGGNGGGGNGKAATLGAPLSGKILAMIFSKPSTRTRVSFEVAARQLGGSAIVLDQQTIQLGYGETIADTARVLSRFVDIIMMRTDEAAKIEEMAEYSSVPVINGLTDRSHPCQVMADILTLEERRGAAADQIVAWTGDGNNVAQSWIHAAAHFGFELRVATPAELAPEPGIVSWARNEGARVTLTDNAEAAVAGADCVVADTWVSMGDGDSSNRHNLLAPFQVNDALMAKAKPDAIFMHCLPVHRGEEVTASVIDGPQSVVWDEAENRLHIQKSILAWCLGKDVNGKK